MTLNCVEAITRIRERIHDRQGLTFDAPEVLRVLDDTMRQLFTVLRTHGDNSLIDNADVALTALTQVETGVYQYTPPEWMGDMQMVEATRVAHTPTPIPRMPLEHKDLTRGTFNTSCGLVWVIGPRDSIQVRGSLSGFSGLKLWFTRRVPPLFYCTPASGSTTTIVPGTTAQGAYKARDDIYVGQQFEMVDGTYAGQVRRCTGFTAGTLTVDSAYSATTSGRQMAMLLPLADEHAEYLCALAALKLFRRQGSLEEMQALAGEVALLQQTFESGIARPHGGEPPRLYSSRRI